MAELKTFDTGNNYMKNVLHGYVDIVSSGYGEYSVVAVPVATPNFFVFHETDGEIRSPRYRYPPAVGTLYGGPIGQVFIESGYLKVTIIEAVTIRIYYAVYIDD